MRSAARRPLFSAHYLPIPLKRAMAAALVARSPLGDRDGNAEQAVTPSSMLDRTKVRLPRSANWADLASTALAAWYISRVFPRNYGIAVRCKCQIKTAAEGIKP